MRLLISFFLSLIIYIAIIFFLIFYLLPKPEKKKEVLIHTVIKVEETKQIEKTKKILKTTQKQEIKKEIKKVKKSLKTGSKSNITKRGEVKFSDIFKNVNENIDTAPLKLKKYEEMSRYKGIERVKKLVNKVKNINFEIKYENRTQTKITKSKINEIINKIGEVWYELSDIPGEYAKINITNNNGQIYVTILDSNIDKIRQKELINRIKNLKFKQSFDLNILFQTKVNK